MFEPSRVPTHYEIVLRSTAAIDTSVVLFVTIYAKRIISKGRRQHDRHLAERDAFLPMPTKIFKSKCNNMNESFWTIRAESELDSQGGERI